MVEYFFVDMIVSFPGGHSDRPIDLLMCQALSAFAVSKPQKQVDKKSILFSLLQRCDTR